jgi:hypothetical protein
LDRSAKIESIRDCSVSSFISVLPTLAAESI